MKMEKGDREIDGHILRNKDNVIEIVEIGDNDKDGGQPLT